LKAITPGGRGTRLADATVSSKVGDRDPSVPMLEMRGITKRFPGVVANDGIDFDLKAGEVHTLLGENGAGKSTLMRVLYGLYKADEGEIFLRGERVTIASPAAAIRNGIGMIHQHFMLVATLTVAQNVALGLPSSRRPLTDLEQVSARIRELSQAYGLWVDPDAYIWQLSVGERQRVEIMKALYRNASLLVLDEPTAVLTPQEVDELFKVFRQMVADGRGLVFISHKIREVLALSDRITVLRDGKVVGTVVPGDVTRRDLANMMVGRDVNVIQNHTEHEAGEVRLAVRALRVPGDRGTEAVRGVDLEVRSGEIVGIAGVSGNGQRELAEAIAGLRTPSSGSIQLDRSELARRGPAEIRAEGLGYVPEERMRDGVIADFSVADNLMLVDSRGRAYSKLGFLRSHVIKRRCQDLVAAFAIKTPGIDTPAHNLSGGNIQKLILARELSGQPRVLLVAQPTRGIDVGATEYIHQRLIEQRRSGTAIVIISEDLDEVLALSDRVVVMYEGEIIGGADPRTASRETIGLMMAGVRAEPAEGVLG
jgi:general nucleoside transport system ATP-binding protein